MSQVNCNPSTHTTIRIADVAQTTSGATPSRSRADYWRPAKIPWIKTGEIAFRPITSSEESVSTKAIEQCSLPILPPGTVLIAMYGQGKTRGQSAVLEIEATINQACFAILPNAEFHPSYLQYWLRKSYQALRSSSEGRGGNQSNLNGAILNDLRVPWISRNDQLALAQRLRLQLSLVDEARASARVQFLQLQTLKTRAMELVFAEAGDRLPIGTVAKLQSGFAFKSSTFKMDGIRLLRNTNILPGTIYWDSTAFIDEQEASSYSAYLLKDRDVLISLDRPLISTGIKVAQVRSSDLPALLVQRVGRFLIDDGSLDADYLYAFLQTGSFIAAISGHDQSLGVPHISPTQVEAVEIPLPRLPIQKKLAVRLACISGEWDTALAAIKSQLHELGHLEAKILASAFGAA